MCRNGVCRNPAKAYSYGLAPNRRRTQLCDACYASLTAVGMGLREERRADPNRPDRTHRPAWLSHLNARDETGRVLA